MLLPLDVIGGHDQTLMREYIGDGIWPDVLHITTAASEVPIHFTLLFVHLIFHPLIMFPPDDHRPGINISVDVDTDIRQMVYVILLNIYDILVVVVLILVKWFVVIVVEYQSMRFVLVIVMRSA